MLCLLQRLVGKHSHTLLHKLIHLVVQFGVLLDIFLEGGDYVGGIIEQLAHLLEGSLHFIERFLNPFAGDGLDTADTGGDTAFRDNTDHTDIAGIVDMCAAAKLYGIAVTDHAHFIAIFLAEERHSTHSTGLLNGHIAVLVARTGFANILIGQTLHFFQFLGGNLLEVREVEAQHVGRHKGAFLLNVCAEHLAQGVMQQVCGGVVGRCAPTGIHINLSFKLSLEIGGKFGYQMNCGTVLALGVENFDYLIAIGECAAVAYLTAHLCIEGGAVEHQLIEFFIFLLNLAVTQDTRRSGELVVADKLLLAIAENHPVGCLYSGSIAGAFFLSGHLAVEALLVERHTLLLQNQLGKVERESVCIIKHECFLAVDFLFAGFQCIVDYMLKQGDTLVESAEECILLLFGDFDDKLALLCDFGISLAHRLNQCVDEAIEEGFFLLQECIGITHGAAQDSANHIAGLGIGGKLAVGDGEGDCADMVGNHAHSHINLVVLAIFLARKFRDFGNHRGEDVGVVVGGFSLESHTEALEAHAGIDYLGGERFERVVGLAVELHKHEVPDFNHLGVVLVDQLGAGHFGTLLGRTEVDMDFRAGAAGTGLAHLPEVVVLVAVDDVRFRKVLCPVAGSFVVAAQTLSRATLKYCSVEMFGIQAEYIHKKFPGPVDGLFLEIIAKRPVAEHLEHCVVVGIEAHLFEVVVLAADAQTFLAVGHTGPFGCFIA